jgi:hypothetical protein
LPHRRIADIDTLNTELAAWQHATNTNQRQVQWQFTTADARITPATYIPTISGDGLLVLAPDEVVQHAAVLDPVRRIADDVPAELRPLVDVLLQILERGAGLSYR